MNSTVLSVATLAFILVVSSASYGETSDLDWSQLVDPSVQGYVDPYRELAPEQLVSLVTVGRLREAAGKGEPIDEQQLARETASLVAAGIDIDALIAQRWLVAKRREQAATSGNKAVDGRDVALSGFVIPSDADADGTTTAYLVPERGMCSHMHPPSPNQMVRLRLPGNWQPQALYQPVRVSGLLSIEPTTRTVQVVDGPMPMHATFSMDVASIETSAMSRAGERSQPVPSGSSADHMSVGK